MNQTKKITLSVILVILIASVIYFAATSSFPYKS